MPEHVGAWIGDGGDHAHCHGVGVHAQLGVDAGHDHIERVEGFGFPVEGAVVEDVHLRAGQDAKHLGG